MSNPIINDNGVSREMTDAELAAFNSAQPAILAASIAMQLRIAAQIAMPDSPVIAGILVDIITQLVTANVVDLTKLTVAQRAVIQKIKNNRAALGV